jgi:hypothetical protein
MKKLTLGLGVVLATAVFFVITASAKDRTTTIIFTLNYHPEGSIKAQCIGVVSTEILPGKKGDNVTWKVKNGHGEGHDDDCPSMVNSQVQLIFDDDVMGATVNKKLTANNGGEIKGTISSVALEAPAGSHKYRVFYKGIAAGPDPEIEIDCGGCGPDGNQPKK